MLMPNTPSLNLKSNAHFKSFETMAQNQKPIATVLLQIPPQQQFHGRAQDLHREGNYVDAYRAQTQVKVRLDSSRVYNQYQLFSCLVDQKL